jgi:hypothetical protein
MPVVNNRKLPIVTRASKQGMASVDDTETTNNPTTINVEDGDTDTNSKKMKQSPYDNMSPTTKRLMKRQHRVIIDDAFKSLLAIRAANGGRKIHTDIQTVVDNYNRKNLGFTMERYHLEYKMKIHKEKSVPKEQVKTDMVTGALTTNTLRTPNTVIIASNDTTSAISALTKDSTMTFGSSKSSNTNNSSTNSNSSSSTLNNSETTTTTTTTNQMDITNNTNTTEDNDEVVVDLVDDVEEEVVVTAYTKKKRKGGRVKGKTKKAERIKEYNKKVALTESAKRCLAAKMEAVANEKFVTDNLYKQIIREEEIAANLSPGNVKYETVRSRVKAKNPTGFCAQKLSPLHQVEPLICDMLIELARIGEAQTKPEIIELANELIRKTEHAEAYIEFCEKRQITKDWEQTIVGDRWYQNFMTRFEHKLRRARCKVMDTNRRTYCTYENFANMYDCVYENMVEAGVAIKLDEEVMFDIDGNITEDPSKMFGRPSRYQITRPDRCVYVDETGCNTNCKNDGLIGGQRQVLGKNQKEGGRTSATTDLHFTVLAFTSGTGEPIMCAIILKSEKK